jgi:hypothetical protein
MVGPTDPLAQGAPCSECGEIEKQTLTSTLAGPGQLNIRETSLPNMTPIAQQQLGFGGFTIRCFYYGPFFGRWCCLYFRGRLISCAEMQSIK